MFLLKGQSMFFALAASSEAAVDGIRPPAPADLPVSGFPHFQKQTSQFRLSPASSPQRIHQNNHRTLLGYFCAPVSRPELPHPQSTLKIKQALPLGIRDKGLGIRLQGLGIMNQESGIWDKGLDSAPHYTPAKLPPTTPLHPYTPSPLNPSTPLFKRMSL